MSALPSLPPDIERTVVVLTLLGMVFATKHVVADFLLQATWMARGKERPTGWVPPLLAHASCHAGLTLAITLVTVPRLWWLALIDLAVHLAIDRSKTLLAQRGGWHPDQPQYWWLLGFDQYLHQLTNLWLAAALLLL